MTNEQILRLKEQAAKAKTPDDVTMFWAAVMTVSTTKEFMEYLDYRGKDIDWLLSLLQVDIKKDIAKRIIDGMSDEILAKTALKILEIAKKGEVVNA